MDLDRVLELAAVAAGLDSVEALMLCIRSR